MTPADRVLLIEDDRFLRRTCETSLRQKGFEVLTASTGDEGLRLARSTPPPDVIVLDRLLPKLTGIEVLEALKQDPATAAIPVLILSSSSREEDKREAQQCGAAGYLVKANLSLTELSVQVDRLMKRHDGSE